VVNVNAKLPFAAIRPESHRPVSETTSCAEESVFVQVTTPACVMVVGFGTNADVPNVLAPAGMVIVVVEPDGAGGGVGDGDGDGDGVGEGAEGEVFDE
jgi:hypothetical protein